MPCYSMLLPSHSALRMLVPHIEVELKLGTDGGYRIGRSGDCMVHGLQLRSGVEVHLH
jgi:hypothetical protein